MAISASSPLLLGSASPRRRDILASLGVPFRVESGSVDERARPDEAPREYLERIVLSKLVDVHQRASVSRAGFSAILVADTIVVLGDEILGKPSNVAHAEELLERIAGRSHVVMTRYAISVSPDFASPVAAKTVETVVTMRAAPRSSIARYAATGEGLDKAGAYAAQGIGAFLVARIEGSFTNVVGLPACEVVEDLVALGLIEEFPFVAGTMK